MRLLETALYVADLDRAERFYQSVFQMRKLIADERIRALSIEDRQVLLLFERGRSTDGETTPGGRIPGHDATGQQHIAFAVEADTLDDWRKTLARHDIEIESTVHPPSGGESLYFRDPDGHLIELATPVIWTFEDSAAHD